MKKRILSLLLAVLLLTAGLAVLNQGTPVQAARTNTAAISLDAVTEGREKAAESDSFTGNLLDYLGQDQSKVEEVFDISVVNTIPEGGSQLISEDGLVFQTDTEGKVDFISVFRSSVYSIGGVYVGTDRYLAQAAFLTAGWTEKVLTSDSLGDLWTFFAPDRSSSLTVMTDENGLVTNLALTRLETQSSAAD